MISPKSYLHKGVNTIAAKHIHKEATNKEKRELLNINWRYCLEWKGIHKMAKGIILAAKKETRAQTRDFQN